MKPTDGRVVIQIKLEFSASVGFIHKVSWRFPFFAQLPEASACKVLERGCDPSFTPSLIHHLLFIPPRYLIESELLRAPL